MGDIVDSEGATSVSRLHRLFNDVMRQANKVSRDDLASPLTITLGDEFQGLCPSMKAGAALMRRLRIELMAKKVDCRFALGLVSVRTPVNAVTAWNMMGPGLSDTRIRLERKDKRSAYGFSVPPAQSTAGLLDAIGAALTEIENNWTERQLALAVALILEGSVPLSAATQLGVTQRVYYKIRTAARLELYQQLWDAVFRAMEDLDGRYLKK